jgi:cytoplasmic tRNA 2-thiolation protein 2
MTQMSEDGTSGPERLQLLLGSLDSATSRTDMTRLLKRRLVVTFAKRHNCEAVLCGNSTTSLAERILAETANGRGFSLPWLVADGESPHGIPFYYPMRDILEKEVVAFASLVDPPIDDLITNSEDKPTVSIKNTTIDDLMKQYFESVERDYPSIVANVVKTTGKLEALHLDQVENQCELCDMPLEGQAPERSRLCYGCIRTLPNSVG